MLLAFYLIVIFSVINLSSLQDAKEPASQINERVFDQKEQGHEALGFLRKLHGFKNVKKLQKDPNEVGQDGPGAETPSAVTHEIDNESTELNDTERSETERTSSSGEDSSEEKSEATERQPAESTSAPTESPDFQTTQVQEETEKSSKLGGSGEFWPSDPPDEEESSSPDQKQLTEFQTETAATDQPQSEPPLEKTDTAGPDENESRSPEIIESSTLKPTNEATTELPAIETEASSSGKL